MDCKLKSFRVCKCYKPMSFGAVNTAQLHLFSDASEDGYKVVFYLLLRSINSEMHATFVMRKAKVAILKLVTTHQMELTAATFASQIQNSVCVFKS